MKRVRRVKAAREVVLTIVEPHTPAYEQAVRLFVESLTYLGATTHGNGTYTHTWKPKNPTKLTGA